MTSQRASFSTPHTHRQWRQDCDLPAGNGSTRDTLAVFRQPWRQRLWRTETQSEPSPRGGEAVRGAAEAARARRPRRQTDPNRLCCPPEFLRRAHAARPAAPGTRVPCARWSRGPASAPRRAACCQARSGRGEASWDGPWCRPCPPRCRGRSACGRIRPAHLFTC